MHMGFEKIRPTHTYPAHTSPALTTPKNSVRTHFPFSVFTDHTTCLTADHTTRH